VRGGVGLREGLASRELRLLVLACTAMSLALWAFAVVLAIAAYEAGGTGAVALAVVARVLPGTLARPFTAPLADRHSRRAVLICLGGGATAALAALTLLTALGGPFALGLALAAAFSILAAAVEPAQAALLPGLARHPRQLVVAGRVRRSLRGAAGCVGALAGGAAAATLSVGAGFAVALAASGAGVAALTLMARDPRPGHREARASAGLTGRELLHGLRELRAAPELREPAALLAVVGLVHGLLDVLMVIVAVQLAGLGTGGVGILSSAWGAGMLGGGFAALALLARSRIAATLDLSAALLAVPLALVALAADPVVAIAGFAVLGLGYVVAETAVQTLVQRLAPAASLAHAFAAAQTAAQLAVALGAVLAPLLISLLGIRGALLATALVLPAAVILRWRAALLLGRRAVAPEHELETLRAVDLLAPLPLARVGTLAIRSSSRVVVADEQILLPGDVSARLYVVAGGSFELQAPATGRRLGRGDYFGESALLRDARRGAGVVATADGLLYVVTREDFLRAV
jgi:MFS family permease